MDQLAEIHPLVSIQRTSAPEDLQWCASLMAGNEPWLTLQRDYAHSMEIVMDPLSEVYLFSQNGARIGFTMIKLKGAFTGYIQTIVFSESVRGKGIGEAAIRYMEELIFKVSANVFICVSSFNHAAFRLYRRLGYEQVGVLKDYIIKGCDEFLLRKSLCPLNDFKKQKPVNAYIAAPKQPTQKKS